MMGTGPPPPPRVYNTPADGSDSESSESEEEEAASLHTLEVAGLQNFMEGPIEIRNVSVVDNVFIDSTTNGSSPVAPGPNTTGVTFKGNTISPPK